MTLSERSLMQTKIAQLRAYLQKNKLDGFLVCSPANVSYLSGFRSSDSYLFISPKGNTYLTDFRYLEAAAANLNKKIFSLKRIRRSLLEELVLLFRARGARRIGFEGQHVSYGEYARLKERLGASRTLVPMTGAVEELRQVKSGPELVKIRQAVVITERSLMFASTCIEPGRKEVEIAGELERFIRYHGAYASAFDIIVASGPNSSVPHHVTSERRLRNNEPVLIDMGVDYQGYKSDLTRTFFLGRMTPSFRKIYGIVARAQAKALQQVTPGAAINKPDKIARQTITKAGYGGFFGHSLGHGVGLQVHEAPYLSAKQQGTLKPGMVFTVEPGIYLPGKFGVRIEDMALVTRKGAEVLSGSLNK